MKKEKINYYLHFISAIFILLESFMFLPKNLSFRIIYFLIIHSHFLIYFVNALIILFIILRFGFQIDLIFWEEISIIQFLSLLILI